MTETRGRENVRDGYVRERKWGGLNKMRETERKINVNAGWEMCMKDGRRGKRKREEEQRGVDVSPGSSWILTVAMWNSDWLRVLWEGGPSHLQQGEIQQQGLWPHFCTGSSLCLYFSLQERGREPFCPLVPLLVSSEAPAETRYSTAMRRRAVMLQSCLASETN